MPFGQEFEATPILPIDDLGPPCFVDLSQASSALCNVQEDLSALFDRYMRAVDTIAGIMMEKDASDPRTGAAHTRPFEFDFDAAGSDGRRSRLTYEKDEAINRMAEAATTCLRNLELTFRQSADPFCQAMVDMLVNIEDINLPPGFIPAAPPEMRTIPVVQEASDPLHVLFTLAAQELNEAIVEACKADMAIMQECMEETEYASRARGELTEMHHHIMDVRASLEDNIAHSIRLNECITHYLKTTIPMQRMH